MRQYVDAHPEQILLAYVQMETPNWLTRIVPVETDKYAMLAVANFVSCIAHAPMQPCNPHFMPPFSITADMTERDQPPNLSPLSQSVARDGKTVHVEIYEDGEGGWLLEVVDERGNSTVWEASFASDREALDEALRTIDQEGIDALIGPAPGHGEAAKLEQSLSGEEFDELDDFLAGETLQETSMDVSTLDGFLAAIAIGPGFVRPSEWLPWVWDMDEGDTEPEFESEEQANRVLSLVMRHYNCVLQAFNTDPASFEPLFWRGEQWGAAEWCEGFVLGFMFSEEAWSLLAVGQPAWFTPFLRLGTDEGIEITKDADDAEQWMNEIEPSLLRIHAYWKTHRGDPSSGIPIGERKASEQVVRGGPKIGRNDPCPCGSGKKFKKCCGAAGTPPSVH